MAVYDNCNNKCEKCKHIRKCKLFRDYCGYLERKLKEELEKKDNKAVGV